MRRLLSFLTFTAIACSRHEAPPPLAHEAVRVPASWSDVPGWADDDHAAAFAVFVKSCAAVIASAADSGLKGVCQSAQNRSGLDTAAARAFFEASFRPVRIDVEPPGLLTGYYVPVIAGSPVATPEFPTPLYGAPSNLTYTREQIETGALAGQGLELVWVDPIDAFFAQVQGSARVRLPDGRMLKLEYTAKNTHPYTSIGRVLVERGEVTREAMNMDTLRAWMTAHADEAVALRRENEAFVFFRASPGAETEQGVGAQGVALVPLRSIAIDRSLYAYGTPFFISAELPIATEDPTTPFHQLMIAMDTGTAITGPARADIYWGVGDAAARVAGRIKQRGTFYVLEPR